MYSMTAEGYVAHLSYVYFMWHTLNSIIFAWFPHNGATLCKWFLGQKKQKKKRKQTFDVHTKIAVKIKSM